MADPLSIAASVAGLIALSGSIYKIVGDVVERNLNPPQSAHTLLLSVAETRIALKSVSDLVDNFLTYPSERRSLIHLDHLIICLTQTVISFSDLEKFVNAWVVRSQSSLRWQWIMLLREDEKISMFNKRLQENKVSIVLVLNILQCESDIDAQRYRISLHEMMDRIISENRELRTRVDDLGSLLRNAVPSISTALERPGATSIIEPQLQTRMIDDDDTLTIRDTVPNLSSGIPRLSHRYNASFPVSASATLGPRVPLNDDNIHIPFEYELARSWVYSRVRRTECDISFTSQPQSALWSMLSGLSLSQISNISIIALPITLNDVSNSTWFKESTRKDLSVVNLESREDEISSQADIYYDVEVLGGFVLGESTVITKLCYEDTDRGDRNSSVGLDQCTSVDVDGVECRLRMTPTPGLETSDNTVMVNEAIKYARGVALRWEQSAS